MNIKYMSYTFWSYKKKMNFFTILNFLDVPVYSFSSTNIVKIEIKL